MATTTSAINTKIKVSNKVSNRMAEEHTEMLELLDRLLVIANDERYRNLSRFNRMRELLNEWDDEETDR